MATAIPKACLASSADTCGGATKREVEMLATPGERGVIGRGQLETQHPEDRRQEAFSLPQGQVDDEPERQRGFDGEIGILPLPATFADPHGLPSGDRIRGQPHGDIASLDQCSVVCRPISDVVLCLVLRVHARLHVEIIHLPSLRWPGGRSWRTEGAGSVHQRLNKLTIPFKLSLTTLEPGSTAPYTLAFQPCLGIGHTNST